MKSKTRETWKLLRKARGAYTSVEWWGEIEDSELGGLASCLGAGLE